MNQLKPFLLISILLLTIVSCKTQKETSSVTPKKKSATLLLQKLEKNQIDYEWFGVKANVHYQDSTNTESFSSTIRLRKDSIIWMNFKKISVEGGRAIIRPDSIFIINRVDKEYYARDFNYLKQAYNIDVNFATLQQLIVGNAIQQTSGKAKAGTQGKYHRLTRSNGNRRSTFLLNPLNYLLEKMLIEEEANQRTIEIEYDQYRPVGQTQIAHKRNITLQSPETGTVKVRLNYSKVELNVPKNTPFTVSPRYRIM